jgi:hypothetical protein
MTWSPSDGWLAYQVLRQQICVIEADIELMSEAESALNVNGYLDKFLATLRVVVEIASSQNSNHI